MTSDDLDTDSIYVYTTHGFCAHDRMLHDLDGPRNGLALSFVYSLFIVVYFSPIYYSLSKPCLLLSGSLDVACKLWMSRPWPPLEWYILLAFHVVAVSDVNRVGSQLSSSLGGLSLM